MLLDRGLLVEDGGTYRAEGSLESLEVPESLHALIAARLDSLQPEERQLLQDASVIGKSFTSGALRAITVAPEDALAPALTSLVNKDLLAIQSDPRSPERGQYVFLQDLVRNVAYGTLGRRDRKLRHLAVATYLESGWNDEEEVAEVVAAHLVEAYEAERDAHDAEQIRVRARDALVKAGDHAASLAAATSAQHYYERALQLAEDADRAELLARAGEMAWLQLKAGAARAHFEEALALHEAAGRIGAAARLAVSLAAIDVFELRSDAALARVETAFAALVAQRQPDNPATEADLAIVAAEVARRLYLLRGSSDVALERVELALDIAERYGLWPQFCEAINTKGLVIGGRGRHAESLALLECALQRSTALQLHAAALRAYNNLAALSQEFDLVRAESLAREGAALARLVGDRRSEIAGTLGQVPILADLGRWDEALAVEAEFDAMASEGVAESDVPRELLYAVWLHMWRGDEAAAGRLRDRLSFLFERSSPEYDSLSRAAEAILLRAAGDNATALEITSRVIDGSKHSSDDVYLLRWVLAEAAEAAFALGDLDSVGQLVGLITGRFRRGLGPALDAMVSLILARLAAAQGRDAEVADHARDAADLFDSMHMPFWVAVAQAHHGEWLVAQGRDDEAAELLTKAAAAFRALGATPWLERVTRAAHAQGMGTERDTALPA
jgi:tetratricopeptide (TPR) repeat protein